jgi:tetratricopeptide (TPR) repeat protein
MPEDANAQPDAEADTLLDHALDHMAAGHPAEAIPLLRRAVALAPDHPAASHALLRALEDSGDLDAALALVHTLIARDPNDPLPHTRLSILLQKKGDVPAAEAASARARILEWKRQLRTSPSEDPDNSFQS